MKSLTRASSALIALLLDLAVCRGVLSAEPPLAAISFEGSWPIPVRKARGMAEPALGKPFDPAAAQAASQRLMEALRNEYYPLARVRWKATPLPSGEGMALAFAAEPGPRGRLTELRFKGNSALSDAALAAAVSTRPRARLWDRISGNDVLLVESLAADQVALLQRYQDAGYRDAEIGKPDLEWLGEGKGFRLTWNIVREGPVYRIGQVRFEGDFAPWAAATAERLGVRSGEVASPTRLRSAVERMRDTLIERGHGFATVAWTPEWKEADARADLVLRVHAGAAPRLREIRLSGNTVTRDHVLLREIPLRKGDAFDAAALRVAQADLERTGLFEAVEMEYGGDPEGAEFDLDVRVRERRTGRFELGVTYGSREGAALLVQARERNLALGAPWRGHALQAFASATLGSRIRRLDAGLSNPRIGASRWALGGRVFAEDNAYVSDFYDQKTREAQINLGHPLGGSHTLSLGYVWTAYDVYNIEESALPGLSAEDTHLNLTAIRFTWTADRVNRDFRPTQGVRLANTFAYGARSLGGDTDVLQYNGRAAAYLNPIGDQTLILRAGAAAVDSHSGAQSVPMPLRVWLGGSENLRGFEYRSVSPFDEKGVPVGGRSLWWAGVEYRAPVFPRLDISVYYDLGDVSAEAWRFGGAGRASDWGVGFLIAAENFPVRFDIAFPLTVPEGDPRNKSGDARISFSAGYAF